MTARSVGLRPRSPSTKDGWSGKLTSLILSVTLVAVVLFGVFPAVTHAEVSVPTTAEFVNVSATGSFSFVPNTFTVSPGTTVDLTVTQLANFNHTFTLSPVVNVTIPSSSTPAQVRAFFNAHAPIVNLSLGPIVGQQYSATFTAPTTLGAYEFVCLIHFPSMTGSMSVANTPPTSGNSSNFSTLELVAIGAVVGVVVIAIALVAWSRSRRRAP
ncbi:MAG TPA: plastocyanin/azurin family copper-binding protein [Thermoplasmata archaeon]|nr:plastocyanin/azurin family copper-binding protein [Thermoplasmata archaeon]